MLDYYGSIIKTKKEIDTELISKFINQCNENYIEYILKKLREEKILNIKYSISGWNIFGRNEIYSCIQKEINIKKYINQKKLKEIYCLYTFFSINNIKDYDIIRYIWEKENLKIM